jgi:hypothetical protein
MILGPFEKIMFFGPKGFGYLAWKWIRISLESWLGYPDGSDTKTK